MMQLEVKDFYSPDIEDIWLWEPGENEQVCFLLELSIGDAFSDASDIFQVVVATPEGLKKRSGFVLADRATMVIREFDWDRLMQFINTVLSNCAEESWSKAVVKLQKYFEWEYDDFSIEEVNRDRH